jgi:LCP family protein required for cell wall assembly
MPDLPDQEERPEYTRYRARPRLFKRRDDATALAEMSSAAASQRRGWRRIFPRGPITPGRVIKWIVVAVIGWIVLSVVLFVISAQFVQDGVGSSAENALTGSGWTLTSANNILVLGSDARVKGSKEPGADVGGPQRSDTILLLRLGGGHSSRLSIPRDTVVPIPGHGPDKINAAFAIGGAGLTVQTIQDYLHIPINHVVEINFAHFPQLIDAMGGIDYSGSCVVSKINGGFKNGGFTLRLKTGTHHIDGKQALALARTRENLCNPRENDLSRARRQQKIFSAMKSQILSPEGFLRLPWIAWQGPQAIRSDMGAVDLSGMFGSMALGGTPPTEVLRPTGATTTAQGGAGLTVSPAARAAAVARFMRH